FSVCTADQAVAALFLCRRIREDFPRLKTCLGGPWVGASWDALPRWPELFSLTDFMVGFSGEVPLERLIRHVRGELPVTAVENLAYRQGRKVLRTPFRPSLPLEDLPPPALDGFELDRYVQPSLPYQTTQGCEWGRCSFCHCVFPKQAFDRKSPEKTLREMESLARGTGLRSFVMADLSTPIDVIEGMAPHWRRMRATWRAMARVHERFTPAFARRLKASGCEYLFFGLETAGREGLGRLRKGISLKTVDATVRACGEAGVRVGLFTLNYPGQPESELLRTLEFCVSRRRFLADLAVNRFKMGHWMTSYSDMPGRPSSAAARDLNSFDLPYEADGVPIERFLELKSKAEGIVNGNSEGPSPGGTPR
ncbi:MAG: radical SAM protein, partial [Elusimicrobia bacterium]|nr:radical SAM protein [Elusimicrobiota bacterium]